MATGSGMYRVWYVLSICPSQVQASKTSPPRKKQKIHYITPVTQQGIALNDDDVHCSKASITWLTLNRCTLLALDKEEIVTGKMLTDKHMKFT